jgi:FMN-dependent NADH-azoreductase
MSQPIKVLLVTASPQQAGSVTRRFAGELLDELRAQQGEIELIQRDVSTGLPVVDSGWIEANFTPAEQRTPQQQRKLALSDKLVEEIIQADLLLIASPIYNFSIPASLKAWIDMVARVGRTFRYTSEGPVGLLEGKKAFIVMASGGTLIGTFWDLSASLTLP